MAEVDPETLLEWLQMGQGEERDMQLIALEQLCMLLLMSDNVDRCFESCPPRTFLPALCRIFLDEHAPDNVLEVTARAITYYLDVSAECTRRIVAVDGAVKALCNRLVVVELSCRTSKDLAEQCIKVLELMCTRESGAVFEAGGLHCVLSFIRDNGSMIHKDTLHSAMAVVSRLCGKMEPSDTSLETCVESLSTLLKHEDPHVADGALRCFASLADRFTRRGVDPAPLARHGLTNELLERLANCGQPASFTTTTTPSSTPRPAAGATPDSKSNPNISTVISLLSTLCRGSPTVTHDLLRSDLPASIEKALMGDERCVLDTMRLVDLLLVLLFEGRKALPKSSIAPRLRSSTTGLRRLDSAGERTHRHLIDCIRSKDTDALIDAIDTGVEVNYMDDVGQTLLNWASAFGTQEMVEFLCERGADVNRGQRSSSLHYAACFGRPQVAKTLLRHGANPDLRDEDGKTPLDKARERNDEGHREVMQILQSPGEWMVPVSSATESTITSPEEIKPEDGDREPKGDPEMAPVYLRKMLPIFAQVYNNTMMPSVRKATLALIRKMIHYAPSRLLCEICSGDLLGFTPVLVEVLAAVLDHEDDDEGHLTALQIIQDLMYKGQDLFLDHFARLGVFSKVSSLVGPLDEDREEEGATAQVKREIPDDQHHQLQQQQHHQHMQQQQQQHQQPQLQQQPQTQRMDDSKEVVAGRPYSWKDWCLARGRDCLYIWSDAAALELSNGSNGWFRFILDGKLATMYSSGSPEGGSDSSESRSEFLEKLQRARSQVMPAIQTQPILSIPGPTKLVVGNWTLQCKKEGELVIHNSDGQQQQATVLREDLAGFIFESNRGTKHSFIAETSLGPEFSTGWTGKRGRRFRSKLEQVQQKVKTLARELYEGYFKVAESHPRDVVAKLNSIVMQLEAACDLYNDPIKGIDDEQGWMEEMKGALETLTCLLREENNISAYELHSSGLVQALLYCLSDGYDHVALHDRYIKERVALFKSSFRDNNDEDGGVSPSVMLVRKLVAVLESIERLPLFIYDSAGSSYGLQVLTRRLRFRLERATGETALIDRTGRTLKMEPLTTVASLERYLLKMVAKQWYDYERTSFTFVHRLKEAQSITFRHTHDFDDNGIVYWVGTNAKTAYEWVNPGQYGLIVVSSSDGRGLPYGRLEDILSRDSSALNCHTNDDKRAWYSIDLGLWVIPSAYTLRHARGYGRSALRNWQFQMSKDGISWMTLLTHTDDCSLNEPGSSATWPLEPSTSEKKGWRYIRLQQMGKNASGQTHYLSLSGFELYGTVTGVVEENLSVAPAKVVKDPESSMRKQRKLVRSQVLRQMVMGQRGRSTDWRWREFEGAHQAEGLASSERESLVAAVLKAAAQNEPLPSREPPPLPRMKTVTIPGTRSPSVTSSIPGSTPGATGPILGRNKSNSTPSLSAGEGPDAGTACKDKDHASTSDLSAPSLASAAVVMENQLMRSGLEAVLAETEAVVDGAVSAVLSGGRNKRLATDSEKALSEAIELPPPTAGTGSTPVLPPTTSSMSVSVPNLSSNQDVVSSLADTFPSLMRQSRGSVGSGNSTLSNRTNTFTSSFVRFPYSSSGLPSNNYLSSAQSAPNLPGATTTSMPTSASTVLTSTLSSALATSLTSTSSESDNEFLEPCPTSSLMAELEDEEFPEPEDLDDENEDDSDGEDYDDGTEEEDYDSRGVRRKTWDDEHVLKRQFSALVPAFDPRPGRTNVQQTTDLEIPPPGTPDTSFRDETDSTPTPRLGLFLRGPGLQGVQETEVYCEDLRSTIFRYVQMLYQQTPTGTKHDRLRRIWEPTYTVVYRESRPQDESTSSVENTEGPWTVGFVQRHLGTERLPKTELIMYLQEKADAQFLRRWKLTSNATNIRRTRNSSRLIAAYREFIQLGLARPSSQQRLSQDSGHVLSESDGGSLNAGGKETGACSVDDVLQLLRILYAIATDVGSTDPDGHRFNVPPEEFYSKKITNKLAQQVQDPLVLASLSLPKWCERLTNRCPMLFPFETRQLYFTCTAFGVSRAIAWLQGKREANTERVRTPSTRRDDHHEFQVGRLKHERVKVPRGEQLVEWAINVMRLHCAKKSILEVEFLGEEGTGLGPTLEFYALIAAELQRKSLGMWLTDDEIADDLSRKVDLGEGEKPPGYYIQKASGLFPAPIIQDSEEISRIEQLYNFLGTFLAKCLQDNRMVDIPLSRPFLKLMCMGETGSTHLYYTSTHESYTSPRDSEVFFAEMQQTEASLESMSELISDLAIDSGNESKELILAADPPKPCTPAWFAGVLTWSDFELIDPHRARFLQHLQEMVDRKRQIQLDGSKTEEERNNEIQNLCLETSPGSGVPVRLEDLGLTFQFNPSSKVYGYHSFNLKPNGDDECVSLDNAEEYIELVTDFCLHTGIRRQMEAFRDGFNQVFPIEKLHSFSPAEFQTILSGDQAPSWTRDDILNYTEPKLGYTRESPGFQRFVNVLSAMNGDERKSFLQFTTGCSSLPPGGLANLHPRLTIVRKVDANDHTYPSVNTCVHYLKLPEYSNEDTMRERLLSATKEKGFHLN
ncbi:E3 ubiquitin-protein ligase HECTD1 isoform X1 [Strongylocentrotus purpuratus]|uniref:E3 ubiquitin-protein ligase n=1 Tax=Strongylocentrotus purpuratus TaxID=7668 RepID=A0A7M7T5C8_STRPU|nr:E3 ubiquitin-protein ligase HECTD1 isoform X1 [Strongylocentrotus purpuratus]XP_030855100.1 E3 ubiquitin-protein ligase HECTD1 isoform X1 [Strongylocentrotus purpuratus]